MPRKRNRIATVAEADALAAKTLPHLIGFRPRRGRIDDYIEVASFLREEVDRLNEQLNRITGGGESQKWTTREGRR